MDRRRRMAGLVLLVLALGGCRSGARVAGQGPPSPAPSQTPDEWVAVFAVGDPHTLEDETALIQRRAPGNVAVQPASCWEGLADQLEVAGDAYVAAVVGSSEQEVDRAASRVGLEVVFQGGSEQICEG